MFIRENCITTIKPSMYTAFGFVVITFQVLEAFTTYETGYMYRHISGTKNGKCTLILSVKSFFFSLYADVRGLSIRLE